MPRAGQVFQTYRKQRRYVAGLRCLILLFGDLLSCMDPSVCLRSGVSAGMEGMVQL